MLHAAPSHARICSARSRCRRAPSRIRHRATSSSSNRCRTSPCPPATSRRSAGPAPWPTTGSPPSTSRRSTRWCRRRSPTTATSGRGGARRNRGGVYRRRQVAAVAAGEFRRPRRRQDERRLERPAGRRILRVVGARPVGSRARRRALDRTAIRIGGPRGGIRATVDRRTGGEGMDPRHRGAVVESAGRSDAPLLAGPCIARG